MQQSIKRIGAFLLALLVCVATSAFTLNVHYCGAKMVSYNTIGKAKPCCKVSTLQFSKKSELEGFNMNCCKDKQLEKKSQDQLTYTIVKPKVEFHQLLLRLPQLLLADEFHINSTYLCTVKRQPQNYFFPYDPEDRCIQYQTFLI